MQDTSAEAMAVQAGVHRTLGGPRKLLIACEMSDSVRAMAKARIQAQHPDFDDAAVLDELIWELYGVRRQR